MISTYCKHCDAPAEGMTLDDVALCNKCAAELLAKNNKELRTALKQIRATIKKAAKGMDIEWAMDQCQGIIKNVL